ncbi:MAG: rhomboid family intramembrane serine protease [Hamadaea sp.]|uniref:rhomboid family intramembrane serine protease n=1 Tax=Hamadaea sp. TaxID=2024425 RepID=UPI0017985BC2|nr:rhomboid family intramembrane serine protease [Hamadaea sp.]NUT20820.1 rhomboid family intramembrane serine protease [Hamadaea sp.]
MVIPIYDVNPVRRTPWVTYGLIAANLLALLFTPLFANMGLGGEAVADLCHQTAFFQHYAAIPKELVTNMQLPLVATGAVGRGANGIGCVIDAPTYTKVPALSVLTSMFLHGGWLHLLGNMLFLWVFGNNIEDRFGRIGYLLVYLAAGYAAAYGFALANPDTAEPLIGASGAVSGILGAYLVLFPRARVWSLVPILFFIPLRLPAWIVLGTWFVLQWLYSAGLAVSGGGEVAYLAHVLGFVVGVLAALPFRGRGRPPVPRQVARYAEPQVMWRKTDRGGWR